MHSVFRICKASILLSDIELANWVCVWFVSVQTSLTTPVHLCKILYVPPNTGISKGGKNTFFLLCNIKPLCISLLPVYFIKVLQNHWNLLRYNWDVETLSCDWLQRELSPNLQFVKDFVKFLIFMQCGKQKEICYKGTIWSDWHKWQLSLWFCTFYVQSFHILKTVGENVVIFSPANLSVVRWRDILIFI